MKTPPKTKTTKKTKKIAPRLLDSSDAVQIFRRLKEITPEPRTELVYTNPYTLLVAVTLSAQMTDTGVNKATKDLFAKVDTPQKMLAYGEERLGEAIKTVNFHRTKTKNVMAQAKMLVDRFGGKVPENHGDLVSLPGVGNKTANVILNEAFGHKTIAVDTHIFRVSQRLGLAYGSTPDEIERGLHEIVPEKYKRYAHHWLILHGRYVCKARRPECYRCVLVDICLYPDKNL